MSDGIQGFDGEIERLRPRTEDVHPTRAADASRGRVHVDQIDLVDAKRIAFESMGQQIGRGADDQHRRREGEPGPCHPADDLPQEEVIARPNQEEVRDRQGRHDPERRQADAVELVQGAAQLSGDVGVAEGDSARRFFGLSRAADRPVQEFCQQLRSVVPAVQRRLVQIGGQKHDLSEPAALSNRQGQIGFAAPRPLLRRWSIAARAAIARPQAGPRRTRRHNSPARWSAARARRLEGGRAPTGLRPRLSPKPPPRCPPMHSTKRPPIRTHWSRASLCAGRSRL